MAIVLLRNHDLEGVAQDCVQMDCACGAVKVFPFSRIKDRERMKCPQCGCVSSFSSIWIDKTEKEFNS